ncbi:MAG: DUF1572 family protein [Gemmatimonadota bacterium]
MEFDLASRFLERSHHYLAVEYPAKITAAVRTMPADRLWERANDGANSAGNLVLHLTGNVRQWIVSGIGGAPDSRDRDAEFAAKDGPGQDELLAGLRLACTDAGAVLRGLAPETLGESRVIQGRSTSVFSAIYHVVEHFSGHTGQIILLAKTFTPGGVRFYDDTGGLARPLFMPDGEGDID